MLGYGELILSLNEMETSTKKQMLEIQMSFCSFIFFFFFGEIRTLAIKIAKDNYLHWPKKLTTIHILKFSPYLVNNINSLNLGVLLHKTRIKIIMHRLILGLKWIVYEKHLVLSRPSVNLSVYFSSFAWWQSQWLFHWYIRRRNFIILSLRYYHLYFQSLVLSHQGRKSPCASFVNIALPTQLISVQLFQVVKL